MQRKLVSIQKIESLQPIAGADFIEKAIVLGWSLVVKKGEFQSGDLCAFFEIDSVLPEAEWSEFMRPSKFRVRTKKMRGVLSQGLALPIDRFGLSIEALIGADITSLIGVTKYEPPCNNGEEYAGDFPCFIPKTDEIRLQSAPELLDEIQNLPIFATLKYDGSSATYANLDGKFYVCSRNKELLPSNNAYWQVADRYNLEEVIPNGYAIQGEVYGEGIQKNRLAIKGVDLAVFNVFDIREGRFLDGQEYQDFCKSLGIPVVQTLYSDGPSDPTHQAARTIEDFLEEARGFYSGTTNPREGIVVRPWHETQSKVLGGRLSFKVINNEFLLKGGED